MTNHNVALLFIDHTEDFMNTVKRMLERGERLPGEQIYLVRDVAAAIRKIREIDTIELIVLHALPDKLAIRHALTDLRRASLAQIIVIVDFVNQSDIGDVYDHGANMWVAPIYRPEVAISYFEAFFRWHRHLPCISGIKDIEGFRDSVKMQCGDLTIDPALQTVGRGGSMIELTALEFELLWFFAQNEGRWLTHDILLDIVWKGKPISANAIASRIHYLRKKIEVDPDAPVLIVTKYGAGYKFVSK